MPRESKCGAQSHERMNENRIEGLAGQGERVMAPLRRLGSKLHLTVNEVPMCKFTAAAIDTTTVIFVR